MIMALTVALMLTGCGSVGDPVSYELVQPGQLPAKLSTTMPMKPGSTGMGEVDGSTYAFITADAKEEVEIVAVEKAEVGIEIRYRIKASDSSAPQTKVVKITNLLRVPVGFKKVD